MYTSETVIITNYYLNFYVNIIIIERFLFGLKTQLKLRIS